MSAFVLFMLVAFGWRTWLQYRRTGDSGIRLASSGAVARSASILLGAGLLLAPTAPIVELLRGGSSLPFLARPAVHAIGVAAFAAGFVLTVLAQFQMGASWRIGVRQSERTSLITGGIFGYVRNPIFTGMILAIVGLMLLVPNPLAALAALCTVAGLELQVRLIEEPYLLSTHGETYRAYAHAVGRFVPGLGRLPKR